MRRDFYVGYSAMATSKELWVFGKDPNDKDKGWYITGMRQKLVQRPHESWDRLCRNENHSRDAAYREQNNEVRDNVKFNNS